MQEKYQLMGKLVTINAKLERHEKFIEKERGQNYRVRTWRAKNIKPRVAWIVGISFRQEGNYYRGWGPDDPGELTNIKRVPCYMVKVWPTYKAFPVPIDAITESVTEEPHANSAWHNCETKALQEG